MGMANIIIFAILCAGLPQDAIAGCADEPAADLNEIGRRDSNITWLSGSFVNDFLLTPGWYRTVHNGWQYFMTDSKTLPDYTMCNTYWPIYLQGTHPSSSSITEVPVSYKACVRDYLYPCDISFNVKIRKCENEVHYYLQSTRYFSAYCFDKHNLLKVNPPAPTDVVLGQVTVKPELRFRTISYTRPNQYNEYIPFLLFVCNFKSQNSYFYTVDWKVDGAFLTSIGPTQNVSSLSVEEDFLINRNITLGAEFRCGVGVSTAINGEKTGIVESPSFYAGVKVIKSTIYLKKGQVGEVLLQPTIPIGCRYSDSMEINVICENSGFVQMFVNVESKFDCKKGGIAGQVDRQTSSDQCSSGFKTLQKNSTWDPSTIHRFRIVTTDIDYEDKTEFNLKFQFNKMIPHRLLRNFQFPNIKVYIIDDKAYQRKICYSHIDPHIRTADNYYYEQQRPGYFMLYENVKYGIEVQEQTTRCFNRATCTCGVIVRAGKDVFMINLCGQLNYFDFISCGDGGILQVQKVHTHLYHIYTPIGTLIAVTLYDQNYYAIKMMNVDITMAPKDFGNVRGLCGYFDNDKSNDLLHQGGRVTSKINNWGWNEHYNFSDSWSLLRPNMIDKNLFNTRKRQLDSWQHLNGLFCVCGRNNVTGKPEAVCSPSQYLNCKLPNSITENKCRVTNRRRRSSEVSHDKELERLYKLMKPIPANIGNRQKREDTTIITPEEAESFCTKKINGSLAVKSYGEVSGDEKPDAVIAQCAFDVEVGNDLTIAEAHVSSVNNIVKTMMEKEPSYVQNNTEKVELFLLNTCPGNCSGNGFCTKSGECACDKYYYGSDCTIDERDALVIDDIEGGGVCDLADGGECTCFKIRSNNILEGLKCSVNTTKIDAVGREENVSNQSFAGSFEDIYTAECCITDNIAGKPGVFVAKYGVSISNDGLNYSNVAAVHVFDSTCQIVSTEDGAEDTKRFDLKDDYCFIEGHCVQDGEMSTKGCFACKTSISEFNWTIHNPCEHDGICKGGETGHTCVCLPGFKGSKCQIDIDECASNPCAAPHVCKNMINSYSCQCVDGYTGTNCESEIDECDSSPCANGGTCHDRVNEYMCTCLPGYNGTRCEIDIDDCTLRPCMNGGTCVDRVNGFICNCLPGFSGQLCETEINECASSPCVNGGTCKDKVNGYMCTCVPGFSGTRCEIDINECASGPCKNGGSCADNANGYTCTCQKGFTGINCETDINECASGPCKNGGSCANNANGYTCTCQKGFTGINCETDINECASGPCKNGGSCADNVNGYKCTCQKGFTGINCETDINECTSGPCKNGGSCADNANGYKCTCQKGFIGINCETAYPRACPDGWSRNGPSCYFFSNTKGSITNAQRQCSIFGGYLAEIDSDAENSFLLEQMKSFNGIDYYIGLNDINKESSFAWFGTKRALSQTGYSHWYKDEPNNRWDKEDCVVMRGDGYWNDLTCDGPYPYICEINY